jgi:hypothetical protein
MEATYDECNTCKAVWRSSGNGEGTLLWQFPGDNLKQIPEQCLVCFRYITTPYKQNPFVVLNCNIEQYLMEGEILGMNGNEEYKYSCDRRVQHILMSVISCYHFKSHTLNQNVQKELLLRCQLLVSKACWIDLLFAIGV